MTLPVKTTIDDVVAIVNYLKTKPTGVTVAEAKAVLDSKYLDGRKLKAYVAWDIAQADGDKYKLTDRGRRLARAPEASAAVYREVVSSIPAYRSAIEWAYHQGFSELTVEDLAANWHEHHKSALGTDTDGSIKAAVTCFFNVAEGAGLGRYVMGRSGGATRLELDKPAIKSLVEEGPSAPPWTDPGTEAEDVVDAVESAVEQPVEPAPIAERAAPASEGGAVRVFISHGKNMDVVDQVKTILDLADIQWEVAVEEESAAIPVPDKVFGAMRNCNAGIICVSAEEDVLDSGEFHLNQNVLIEIGAAFVLYDRRVVLLWDKRIPVPSNLQGLYRCEFDGDELSWTAGTRLMKAIQGFKQS